MSVRPAISTPLKSSLPPNRSAVARTIACCPAAPVLISVPSISQRRRRFSDIDEALTLGRIERSQIRKFALLLSKRDRLGKLRGCQHPFLLRPPWKVHADCGHPITAAASLRAFGATNARRCSRISSAANATDRQAAEQCVRFDYLTSLLSAPFAKSTGLQSSPTNGDSL